MTTLAAYSQFDGRHWETGTVHNYYAYRGVTAPHTGQPISEALLMGVSGGITLGYFTFLYEGYDPQCNILTRNTFDPLTTLLSRLGIVQHLKRTAKADKAAATLVDTLDDGVPAVVWADVWSLPYNGLEMDQGMWGSFPILVYGYEADENAVRIADRAAVPLTVTPAELAAARGRIKKDRHRLLTLDAPNPDKLASAVRAGLCDTVKLYLEKPPKGSANNFGLKAYRYWAQMLTHPRQRKSWEKQFPAGLPLYAGLTSAFNFAILFAKGSAADGERGLFADFLAEAAVILDRPALSDVARLFRDSAAAWQQLPQALLPDSVPPFKEARELMLRRHQLFLEQGNASLEERQTITARLAALRQQMDTAFPLDAAGVVALRENLAAHLLTLHDLEQTAVHALNDAIS